MTEPNATSTPIRKSESPAVLKEKQQNNKPKDAKQRRNSTKDSRKIPTATRTAKPTSKENEGKQKIRRRSENAYKSEAQRREQAVEAMKILEQRRQRMCQPQPTEPVQSTSVSPVEESLNSLEEKKRLEAKQQKAKRILAFMAEQELKKNKQAIQMQNLSSVSMANYRSRSRCAFKPKVSSDVENSLPVVEGGVSEPVAEATQEISAICVAKICYSKDELRAMNPYGYYFM